ncbi:MAG: GNAT family N-acetyltransferase [Clostridia bacterium]|nr:GNAT family N-acetyltransferase [Clostridia bacterium]
MYIENILIEGAGCGDAYGNINNKEIDISCSDEDLLNQRYFFTIYKTDDELNKQEQIGKVEMTYMDVYMAEETGYGIFDLFDLIDSEKQGVCEYLFDFDGEQNDKYVGMDRDVLYIDEIFIEKKYRNMGIGSLIVKELPRLIRQILKLRPGCLVLLANPFEIEGKEFKPTRDKKKIEKLIKFYSRNGFQRINDTQYLAKNMDFK